MRFAKGQRKLFDTAPIRPTKAELKAIKRAADAVQADIERKLLADRLFGIPLWMTRGDLTHSRQSPYTVMEMLPVPEQLEPPSPQTSCRPLNELFNEMIERSAERRQATEQLAAVVADATRPPEYLIDWYLPPWEPSRGIYMSTTV